MATLPALPAPVPSALRLPHTYSRPRPPLACCWCGVHHCSHCYSSARQPGVGQARGAEVLLHLSAMTLLCRRSRLVCRTASTECASSGCMIACRYAVQHHCASPHAVCACSPPGSSLPIGLATAYTLSAAWQRHLVPISPAARGGVGPSRAIPPYLFGKSLPTASVHASIVGALRAAASPTEPARTGDQREARMLLGGALGCARRRRRPGPAVVLRRAETGVWAEAPRRHMMATVCPCDELCSSASSP